MNNGPNHGVDLGIGKSQIQISGQICNGGVVTGKGSRETYLGIWLAVDGKTENGIFGQLSVMS